jgi:hypothetical protein
MEPIHGDWKPELRKISWWGQPGAWGYGRAALALEHPFLEGLPQGVPLEAQPAYQRIAPAHTWVLSEKPQEVSVDAAVLESCVHVDLPFTADLFSLRWGEGTMVLNTLYLVEYLNTDPAADRILENILAALR